MLKQEYSDETRNNDVQLRKREKNKLGRRRSNTK